MGSPSERYPEALKLRRPSELVTEWAPSILSLTDEGSGGCQRYPEASVSETHYELFKLPL